VFSVKAYEIFFSESALKMMGQRSFSKSAASAPAAGGLFFSLYPDLDNIGGSPHPRTDGNGLGRAVVYAGAAFHAGIEIRNTGLVPVHFKY
jgi:hypothetical protein